MNTAYELEQRRKLALDSMNEHCVTPTMHQQCSLTVPYALLSAREYVQKCITSAPVNQLCERHIVSTLDFGYLSILSPDFVPHGTNYRDNPFTHEVVTRLVKEYAHQGLQLSVSTADYWGAIQVTVTITWSIA